MSLDSEVTGVVKDKWVEVYKWTLPEVKEVDLIEGDWGRVGG